MDNHTPAADGRQCPTACRTETHTVLAAALSSRSGAESGAFSVPCGPAAPLLGIYGGIASAEGGDGWARVVRFALQASARRAALDAFGLGGESLQSLVDCLRKLRAGTVEVLYAPEHQAAVYRGLRTCGSPWSCPVCATKIAVRRREELRAGMAAHELAGGRFALVTYTLRHKLGDPLGLMLDGMGRARRMVKGGRRAVNLAAAFGIVGSVRALEITHGDNGWHPHYHELLFLRKAIAPEELLDELRPAWAAAVERAGLRDVTERGVDVTVADLSVAEYVTKFGHERAWGLESEVTVGTLKNGRYGGRTPIQLLGAYHDGDQESGKLWLHYAVMLKGQRQLWWSPGLRARLGLSAEKTDDELAAGTDGAFSVVLALLNFAQWRVVLANDARAELLGVASRGDAVELWAWLHQLGVVGGSAGDHRCAPARPISAGGALAG